MEPDRIADAFQISIEEVARLAGVEGFDTCGGNEAEAAGTQRRLREMVEILTLAETRFGSIHEALHWYRHEPLPGFSGRTAMHLLAEGRAAEIWELIAAVDAGVHT